MTYNFYNIRNLYTVHDLKLSHFKKNFKKVWIWEHLPKQVPFLDYNKTKKGKSLKKSVTIWGQFEVIDCNFLLNRSFEFFGFVKWPLSTRPTRSIIKQQQRQIIMRVIPLLAVVTSAADVDFADVFDHSCEATSMSASIRAENLAKLGSWGEDFSMVTLNEGCQDSVDKITVLFL